MVGELVAGGAEIRHAHGLVVELVLLDDGGLNGHAVVVPAGDIGGVVAPHGIAAGDEVLQGLVQGVAHVQGAVGEGRAVVEGEQGLALVLLQQLVVKVQLLPVAAASPAPAWAGPPAWESRTWAYSASFCTPCVTSIINITFYIAKNKRPLSPIRDKGRKTSAVPLLLPRRGAAALPHHPWARDDNGPPPSAPNPGMPFQPDAPG